MLTDFVWFYCFVATLTISEILGVKRDQSPKLEANRCRFASVCLYLYYCWRTSYQERED